MLANTPNMLIIALLSIVLIVNAPKMRLTNAVTYGTANPDNSKIALSQEIFNGFQNCLF